MLAIFAQAHFALLSFFILMFGSAAVHKAADIVRFSGYVKHYSPHFERFSLVIAYALVTTEIIAIVCALLPATQWLGECLFIALLTGYTIAMAIALSQGNTAVECGCGGTSIYISYRSILRNMSLILLALTMLWFGLQSVAVSMGALEIMVSIVMGLGLWLMYFFFEQLLLNHDLIHRLRSNISRGVA